MRRESTSNETRPDAKQLRGEGEYSHDEAQRRPEDLAGSDADAARERARRDDLAVAPEDLAARFLSDAVQAGPGAREEEGADTAEELPVADEEKPPRERSRADLPPHATPEGERR